MKYNNKGLSRISKLIRFVITTSLVIFLVLLSGKIIRDVGVWGGEPSVDDFKNTAWIKEQEAIILEIKRRADDTKEKQYQIQKTLTTAEKNHKDAKEAFDSWIEARRVIGKPKEDREVRRRLATLDTYYQSAQAWREKLSGIQTQLSLKADSITSISASVRKERIKGEDKFNEAYKSYEIKIFSMRLLFFLPILGLAILFVVKFRRSRYWYLYLGFVIYALFAFFVELAPYMPSYGGYVRYSVGIALTVLAGVYSTNVIRRFVREKKKELEASTEERSKKVETEVAEQALDASMCPSCGKGFVVSVDYRSVSPTKADSSKKNKNRGNIVPTQSQVERTVTSFCRYCGLELFRHCDNCGTRNYVHLPYCSECGEETRSSQTSETKESVSDNI